MLFFTEKKSESLLYSYFHEFHSELNRIKRQIQGQDWAQNIQQDGALPESLPFRADLLGLLDKQGLDAAQRGGEHGARLYRELKYLMVALADEFFLHLLPWDGRKIWHKQLLELSIFNTQAAGQKVFEQIDQLLSRRDPITLELARIYLVVLALGFQGRYRDSEDHNKLAGYRHQLYAFITQRDPEQVEQHLYHNPTLRIFPQAYQYTYAEEALQGKNIQTWLPVLSNWYMLLFILLGGLTLSSIILWHVLSHDVVEHARVILQNTGYYHAENAMPDTALAQSDQVESKQAAALQREATARLRAEKAAAEAQLRLQEMERQLAAQQEEAPKPQTKQPQTFIWDNLSYARGAAMPENIPMERLNELIALLAKSEQTQVLIKGYTDNTGPPERNLELSQQRADKFRTLLIAHGIAAQRITAIGYGDRQPVADNTTDEGRQRNRRIEIMVF